MRALILLACLLTTIGTPVRADPSVADYRAATGDGKVVLDFYVSATADAYLWANAAADVQGGPPLYCPPARLALTSDQVSNILSRWIEGNVPYDDDAETYLALEVLRALQDTFPCAQAAEGS